MEKLNVGRLILLKKKSANYLQFTDLRPIQVNSVLIKVMEKAIMGRVK